MKLLRRSRAFAIIQMVANLSVILIAILLSVGFVKQYLGGQRTPDSRLSASRAEKPKTPKGNRIVLPGVDWYANGRTLVLALKSGCRFCTDSGPFYRELVARQSEQSAVHLIAVF